MTSPRVVVAMSGGVDSCVAAARVVAADLAESSLAVARAMGADKTVNLSAGEVLPADCELVFEASGAAAALGAVLLGTPH